MTTITFELPDDVAEQARREGLLDSGRIQTLLEQALTGAANTGEACLEKTKASRRRPCAQLANSARFHDDLIRSGDTGDWESA